LATWIYTVTIVALAGLLGCGASCPEHVSLVKATPEPFSPHDPQCYTQGFLYDEGLFWEVGGQYGASHLRVWEPSTQQLRHYKILPAEIFAEGCALLGERLYVLTWKAGKVLVFDRQTMEQVGTHQFPGEGWGLTTDGRVLYLSDGTDTIRVYDPEDFTEIRRFSVRKNAHAVTRLNELEWIEGALWANVYGESFLVTMDAERGCLTGIIQFPLQQMRATQGPKAEVFNGIAFDPSTRRLFVTGKYWRDVFVWTLP
jgi:glutamine cyclotransferase